MMAMKNCGECGAEISTKAEACPKCGAKQPKQTSGCTWLVAICFAVPFLFFYVQGVYRSGSEPAATQKKAERTPDSAPSNAGQVLPETDHGKFKEGGGAWKRTASKDSMSGKQSITLEMPASRFASDKYGRKIRSSLIVQCRDSRTAVIVNTDTFLSTQGIQVTHKIDGGKPVTRTWSASTDYQAMFAPQAIGLLKAMQSADDLLVRLTPHGESPIEFHYTIAGLQNYVPEIRKACDW